MLNHYRSPLRYFAASMLLVLLAYVGAIALAGPARAAPITDPVPACSPWKDGQGLVVSRVQGALGAAWWCPPVEKYGSWVPARAAILTDGPDEANIQALIDARDFAGLIAARNTPMDSPRFAPVWGSLTRKQKNTQPPGPWFVAYNGSAAFRSAYDLDPAGQKVKVRTGEKIPVNTPCNCSTDRVVIGTSTYCPVPGHAAAVCAKK